MNTQRVIASLAVAALSTAVAACSIGTIGAPPQTQPQAAPSTCGFFASNGLYITATGTICSQDIEAQLATEAGEAFTRNDVAPWPVLQTTCTVSQDGNTLTVQVLQVGLVSQPIMAPAEASTVCTSYEQQGWTQ